jgi:hypothetical protein
VGMSLLHAGSMARLLENRKSRRHDMGF